MGYRDDCPSYLNDYLNYIYTIKGRSELTLKNYYSDLRLFLRFLKIKNSLVEKNVEFSEIRIFDVSEELVKKVQLSDIVEFLHFVSSERDNHPKARSRKAVAIRQFFKYLTNTKQWFDASPAQNLELPTPKKALPKHLTVEQATELLQNNSVIETWQDARDYCMLTYFLNCGMRLSELVKINVTDYIETTDSKTGNKYSYIKVIGKGNKERIIYLNEACVKAFQAYLSMRPKIQNEKALFLSKQKTRISNRRVEQIIENKLQSAGLAGMGFSVHKLRHTAATLMYQNGVDVRVLKEVLGHENLDTTQIYTHVSDNQVKQAMDLNPLANASEPSKKKKKETDNE